MKLPYYVMDVFTRDRLAGNPLAVVQKADGLSDARMQAIAGEFNLSETVFVRAPQNPRHAASLRIFTPRVELPFAGHPTVGTAVLLGLQSRMSAVRLELGVGLVTAIMEKIDRRSGAARFALPHMPERLDDAPEAAVLADALGLPEDAIGCGALAPAVYSAGVPFYLIPIRNAALLGDIALQRRGTWSRFSHGHGQLYVFSRMPDDRNFDFAARMFAPMMGIDEDPATGSAAAALIGLLADQAGLADGMHQFALRQGWEMGRPSRIALQATIAGGRLEHAGIGGDAVVLAEGMLDLDE